MRRLAISLLLLRLLGGCSLGDDDGGGGSAQLGRDARGRQGRRGLGFPSTATRNTIRVAGGDATADAAGVASALFPATGSADRPTAVVLVDSKDWQTRDRGGRAGRAADRRAAAADRRGRAAGGDVRRARPARPEGLGPVQGRAGDPDRPGRRPPEGYKTAVVQGDDAVRARRRGRPLLLGRARRPSADVVLYSADSPEWAMPAAAWAARSGDAALPVKRDSIPAAVRKALQGTRARTSTCSGPRA